MNKKPTYELLVIILDDLQRLPDLLKNLKDAGVTGVTILSSIGGYRATNLMQDLGLSGLAKMFGANELKRRTIFSVVEAEKIDAAIAAAEQAVGGFGRPNCGILFTIPVSRTVGIANRKQSEASETLPALDASDATIRAMSVAEADRQLQISPVTVRSSATLMDAVEAMSKSPSALVAAVVSQTGHLLGLVTLRDLADHVFFGIMPEIFMGDVGSDVGDSLDFGKMANVHNISDIMIEPLAVHKDDTVAQAFKVMHKHRLAGLPIVDDNNHVVGFVGMLELLKLVLKESSADHE
ncbi:MAG: hypothetical protein DSY55_06710 [Clostridia bacterium]|nr:MAG: hypothetical protein DSY55_06710 [Clostridia bacterium]